MSWKNILKDEETDARDLAQIISGVKDAIKQLEPISKQATEFEEEINKNLDEIESTLAESPFRNFGPNSSIGRGFNKLNQDLGNFSFGLEEMLTLLQSELKEFEDE